MIGWFETLPEELRRRRLMREGGVLVVRAGHPLTESATRDEIFGFPHAVVELTGEEDVRSDGFHDDRGLVRRVWMERVVLQARGSNDVAARVAVSVPHFMALPFLLRNTDLVATLPVRVARRAVADGGLVMLDPSLEPNVIDIEMVWHGRADADAGLAWIMEELAAACAELEDETPRA